MKVGKPKKFRWLTPLSRFLVCAHSLYISQRINLVTLARTRKKYSIENSNYVELKNFDTYEIPSLWGRSSREIFTSVGRFLNRRRVSTLDRLIGELGHRCILAFARKTAKSGLSRAEWRRGAHIVKAETRKAHIATVLEGIERERNGWIRSEEDGGRSGKRM